MCAEGLQSEGLCNVSHGKEKPQLYPTSECGVPRSVSTMKEVIKAGPNAT